MTRLFGERAYGIYSLFTSWAAFLAVLGLFGMDDSHFTKIPIFKLKNKFTAINDQLKWSFKVNSITVLIVVIGFYIAISFFKLPGLAVHAYYVKFAIAIICLLVIVNNLFCFLRSLDKVIWCEIIDKAGRQIVFMLFLVLFYYSWNSDLARAILVANIFSLCGILIILVLVIKNLLRKFKASNIYTKERFSLLPNLRYVFLNILYMLSVRIDILTLGLLSDAVLVGHYNIAIKFSDIVSYPLSIANLSLPVLFAKYRHQNNDIETPEILYNISKTAFFQSLALTVLLSISGYSILSWYGEGFKSAFPVLCILLANNLLSAFAASIDVFYILHKKEKKVIVCRIISIIILSVMAFILIPEYGITGAALSTFSGNLTYLAMLQYLFYKEYGFIVHPFHKELKLIDIH